jgi:hypothetical protein
VAREILVPQKRALGLQEWREQNVNSYAQIGEVEKEVCEKKLSKQKQGLNKIRQKGSNASMQRMFEVRRETGRRALFHTENAAGAGI